MCIRDSLNRDGVPLLGALPVLEDLGPEELASRDGRAGAILDTRPWPSFAAGHLPGSLFPLSGVSFLKAVGSFVDELANTAVEQEADYFFPSVAVDRLMLPDRVYAVYKFGDTGDETINFNRYDDDGTTGTHPDATAHNNRIPQPAPSAARQKRAAVKSMS